MNIAVPHRSGAKIAFQTALISIFIFFAWIILKPWIAKTALSEPYTIEKLSMAASIDGDSAHYHYLKGMHHVFDPENTNLEQARGSILEAVTKSPANPVYWRGLYQVETALNNGDQAEKAILRAAALSPNDPETRWMLANHYLVKGEVAPALRELRRILESFPGEASRAFPIIWGTAGQDTAMIIREALPDDIEIKISYLHYLMKKKQTDAARLLWRDMAANTIKGEERLRYINYLIDEGALKDAEDEWGGLTGSTGHNPLQNGGFESETLNGGFDWRIGKVEGTTIGRVEGKAFDGKHSLNVRFDGTRNTDFYHISRIVPLQPDREYTLTVHVSTGELTTNGIRIEFYGNGGCGFRAATDEISGTQPWTEYSLKIKTPSGCSSGTIRLRREKSTKLNNLISGDVWIDGIRLDEGQ